MKRFKLFTLMLAAALFLFAAPAHAALQDMQASVYKWEGGMGADGKAVVTKIESGITFKVLAHESDTAETLYYPKKTTSLTNPVTTANFASTSVCNKRVAFRVDPTDATNDRYVDLIVTDTNGGYTIFYPHFDQYTHTIVIDERPNIMHHGILPFGVVGTVNSAVYSGVTFLSDTLVSDVQLEIVTVTAGTMGVGVWGTNTGFLNGISVATAGYVPDPAFYTAAASTKYGQLLAQTYDASGGGHVIRSPFIVAGSTVGILSYTINSATGGAGYIHYFFTRMR